MNIKIPALPYMHLIFEQIKNEKLIFFFIKKTQKIFYIS